MFSSQPPQPPFYKKKYTNPAPLHKLYYGEENKGGKVIRKGIPYKVSEQGIPYSAVRKEEFPIAKHTTLRNPDPIYKAEKIGPRYTDYHADSGGESESEDPNILYRGYEVNQEYPLTQGFNFAPGYKKITLREDLAAPTSRTENPQKKGPFVHTSRSKKAALRYAVPPAVRQAILNQDDNLLDPIGPIGTTRIAKIKTDPTRFNFNDRHIDLTVPGILEQYLSNAYPTTVNSVKSSQQVALNRNITPDEILGTYSITPFRLGQEPSGEEIKNYPRGTSYVRTRIPDMGRGFPIEDPVGFKLEFTENPAMNAILAQSEAKAEKYGIVRADIKAYSQNPTHVNEKLAKFKKEHPKEFEVLINSDKELQQRARLHELQKRQQEWLQQPNQPTKTGTTNYPINQQTFSNIQSNLGAGQNINQGGGAGRGGYLTESIFDKVLGDIETPDKTPKMKPRPRPINPEEGKLYPAPLPTYYGTGNPTTTNPYKSGPKRQYKEISGEKDTPLQPAQLPTKYQSDKVSDEDWKQTNEYITESADMPDYEEIPDDEPKMPLTTQEIKSTLDAQYKNKFPQEAFFNKGQIEAIRDNKKINYTRAQAELLESNAEFKKYVNDVMKEAQTTVQLEPTDETLIIKPTKSAIPESGKTEQKPLTLHEEARKQKLLRLRQQQQREQQQPKVPQQKQAAQSTVQSTVKPAPTITQTTLKKPDGKEILSAKQIQDISAGKKLTAKDINTLSMAYGSGLVSQWLEYYKKLYEAKDKDKKDKK